MRLQRDEFSYKKRAPPIDGALKLIGSLKSPNSTWGILNEFRPRPFVVWEGAD